LGTSDILLNMSESIDPSNPETQQAREELTPIEAQTAPFFAGLFLSFFMYIAAIPLTFAIKSKTKMVRIILLVIGVITTEITNLWRIIPFALLLPAGILALRYKKKTKVSPSLLLRKEDSHQYSSVILKFSSVLYSTRGE